MIVFLLSKDILSLYSIQIIKIGTSCLFDEQGEINYSLLKQKAKEIEESDYKTLLVVSGAIKLGKLLENQTKSNDELSSSELQGYASVGQRILMDICVNCFTQTTAQLLVTMEDMKYKNHIKKLILENIKRNRITIVNYNDSVDFLELRKDNDTLAAELLAYCNADRLIILGTYDGFKDDNNNLIEKVTIIDKSDYKLCKGVSHGGNGGFKRKLDAGKIVLSQNKEMIIGNMIHSLKDIIEGNVKRTLFTRNQKA